ncbi:hypothetical protein EJ02DRAFT_493290 [Clathrospora elynae]|uniref:Uncharacterized protein n=1 Tax=Clathrospora elynae TaxID=706981 RepID=A0A6A5SN46_9PLEO|nr:hypothetical protein EJ02DRAFT_493290 [Clathrospora elynae]
MADNQSSSSSSAADAADAQEQLLGDTLEHGSSEHGEAASPWARYTAKHLMGNCPYAVALERIDTSLWGIPAPADASKAHATTWVAKTIHDYHLAMVWDNHLFDDYLGDFEGWTKEMFLKVERGRLKSLKTVLWHRGVYTGNNCARIANSLYSCEGPSDWRVRPKLEG